MGLRTDIFGLRRVLAVFRRNDALTEKTRQVLVRSLYARPTTLAISAVNGVLSSVFVASITDRPSLWALVFLLSSIAILRVLNAVHLSRDKNGLSLGTLEGAYTAGAFAYAGTLGVFAAMTVVLDLSPMVRSLMIANALGYGIAICAHSAARPTVALGQLVFVALPVMAAAVSHGTPVAFLLALNILLVIPAMCGVTYSVFRVLRDSIAAAERSKALARRMEELAHSDVVTGLTNRAGLDKQLAERLSRAGAGDSFALFWIDLDRFKEVNDLYGHQAGDRVLRETGKRLRHIAGPSAIVARFGGDEFIILYPTGEHGPVERMAQDILSELTRAIRIEGERLEVGGSLGIALWPQDAVDGDQLLKRADIALYEAKAGGRNQLRFFDARMTRDLAHRRETEGELRTALLRDELKVYFQPIVDLASGEIRCFEALVRWFHPQKGEIKPDDFIPIAEDCGAIVTLGNWLTLQAAKAAAGWPAHIRLAVNLSPMQIKVPGAALGILNALREAKLPPERLELEVTENLFLEDSPAVAGFIEELSAVGVRFVLDDFGTGYSSLGYINRWPFSKIKVDRSFVSGANTGPKSDAIIRAVSQMAQTLGMEIVAEGLETPEQVRALRAAGCTLGQGYIFSRAVPDYQAALLLADGGIEGAERPERLAG